MAVNPQKVYEVVTLKGGESPPYNRFRIHTTTKFINAAGTVKEKKESERSLEKESAKHLGLNEAWLKNPPDLKGASDTEKVRIRELHSKFGYWGHLIENDIEKFNAKNHDRCRKLVYALRHGEADHNAWKFILKQIDPDLWAKKPEYKRQPIFERDGKYYCIIDPPLTAQGVKQANDAGKQLKLLKQLKFSMPKRAYVSPLYRAMQTFMYAFASVGLGSNDGYVLDDLREQMTGNCADILIDEFIRKEDRRKPPQAATHSSLGWMENEDKDGKNPKLQKRVVNLHPKIFKIEDSDCTALVTHSLLIRNILMNLEVNGGKILESFMIKEGGLFAYVIEGKKAAANSEVLRGNYDTVAKRMGDVGQRRESAFSKHPTQPTKVRIEQEILGVCKKDAEREKLPAKAAPPNKSRDTGARGGKNNLSENSR